MTLTPAVNASADARLAKIVVAIITDSAVVVDISHGLVAAVAEHRPGANGCSRHSGWFLGAESELALAGEVGDLVEEALAIQSGRHALWLGCGLSSL